jgi:hypothetical protein
MRPATNSPVINLIPLGAYTNPSSQLTAGGLNLGPAIEVPEWNKAVFILNVQTISAGTPLGLNPIVLVPFTGAEMANVSLSGGFLIQAPGTYLFPWGQSASASSPPRLLVGPNLYQSNLQLGNGVFMPLPRSFLPAVAHQDNLTYTYSLDVYYTI